MIVSVPELLREYLSDSVEVTDRAPGGIVVGPVSEEQSERGCVSLTINGQPEIDKYVPMLRMRVQVECLGGTIEQAEEIERAVYERLHRTTRQVMRLPSTDEKYLVSSVMISGGPVNAPTQSGERVEVLYAEVYLCTVPVPKEE